MIRTAFQQGNEFLLCGSVIDTQIEIRIEQQFADQFGVPGRVLKVQDFDRTGFIRFLIHGLILSKAAVH